MTPLELLEHNARVRGNSLEQEYRHYVHDVLVYGYYPFDRPWLKPRDESRAERRRIERKLWGAG